MFNLLLLAIIPLIRTSFSFNCTWSTPNASYDLSSLRLTSSSSSSANYYSVTDNTSTTAVRNYTYLFNVCADILQLPQMEVCSNITLRASMGLPTGYCPEIDINHQNHSCNSITVIDGTVAAYQIYQAHGQQQQTITESCYRLHDGKTEPSWSYIDPQDPTEGVILTYTRGDFCSSSSSNRFLSILFYCADNYITAPDQEETIYEDNCGYDLEIYSTVGCPTECPTRNTRLCAGNGKCDFDFSTGKPKCFCYSGYYGDDCSSTSEDLAVVYKHNDSGLVGGLVVVVLLLVITVGILAYLFFRFYQPTNKKFQKLKYKKKGAKLANNDYEEENPTKASALVGVPEDKTEQPLNPL